MWARPASRARFRKCARFQPPYCRDPGPALCCHFWQLSRQVIHEKVDSLVDQSARSSGLHILIPAAGKVPRNLPVMESGRTTRADRIKSVKPGNSEVEAERLLIERTRAGSSEALIDLVQMHSPRVYNWSFRILQNHEDAEDNTQNVLCKMYAKLSTFKGESRFSTWLFRMTINEALMERRRPRLRPAERTSKPEGDDSCVPDIRDRCADPEQQYFTKELLSRAFLGLHPSLAQVFIRHKGEGWTQRELAEQMGISVAALKARIFQARKSMLTRLRGSC